MASQQSQSPVYGWPSRYCTIHGVFLIAVLRICIGKNIALVEMNNWIAQFLHHFHAEFVNTEKPFVVQTFWFVMEEEEFHISISRR
jgi:Cytochrome P450